MLRNCHSVGLSGEWCFPSPLFENSSTELLNLKQTPKVQKESALATAAETGPAWLRALPVFHDKTFSALGYSMAWDGKEENSELGEKSFDRY